MLTETQKNWLAELDIAIDEQVAIDLRNQRKQAVIAKLISDRQQKTELLKQGASLQVSKGSKSSLMKTVDEVNHDQTTVFDLDEQRDGYALAKSSGEIEKWDEKTGSQEEFQKHLAAAREIDEMVRQMEAETVPGTDAKGQPCLVPLFTPEEIAAEVYQPLMREGLLSETNIPDKYSQTKKMLDSTFEEYAKRLEKDKKSTAKRLFDENFALGKSLVNFVATESSVGVQGAKIGTSKSEDLVSKASPTENIKSMREGLGLQADSDGKWADALTETNTSLGIVGQGITFIFDDVIDGGMELSGLLEGEELDEEAKRAIRAARLAPAIVAAVSMALGKTFNGSGLGLGMAASASFGSVCSAKAIAAELKVTPFTEAQVAAIAQLLGAALKDTLKQLDPATSGETEAVKTAAEGLNTGMAPLPAAKAPVVEARNALDAEALQSAFGAAAESVLGSVLTSTVLAVFSGVDAQKNVKSKANVLMTESFEKDEVDGAPPELKNQHKKDHPGHDADWVKDGRGNWICATCQANASDDPIIFAGALERRIAQLERDQAILKWAVNVVNLGLDTATNFIAPLAIAGCAVKMMKNVYEAGCRSRDTYVFCKKRQGMYNAASAYSAPVSQFIYNGGVQATHYFANAAFECAKMIGAILQCAGPFTAPAGAIMTAAASGTQALEQVLYEAKKRYDLETAWKSYKLSLSRPQNRKLGLIALKKNPTLAKYSVAWGALIEKDVLVVDFIGACGLTPETLRDPQANIDRVVSYLEKRMPDDNVVTGRTVEKVAGWAPGQLELTAASWISVKQRAETQGGLMVVSTRTLELHLQQLASQWATWLQQAQAQPASQLTAQSKTQCLDLLAELIRDFQKAPTELADGSGERSVEMGNIVAEYLEMTRAQLEVATNWATV